MPDRCLAAALAQQSEDTRAGEAEQSAITIQGPDGLTLRYSPGNPVSHGRVTPGERTPGAHAHAPPRVSPRRVRPVEVDRQPDDLAVVRREPPRCHGERRKRWADIALALAVLTLGAPLYVLLGLAIALTSPGPVLYAQRRVGRHGSAFRCWKFRTMVADADARLERLFAEHPELREEFQRTYKLRHDPRVTRVGRFLRKTSLDELPQFYNVLRGDMSVVGPRPLVPAEVTRYGGAITTVLGVRPGITGIWQVSGRNDIPYPTRVVMDAHYACHRTLRGDLWIVVRTALLMLPWARNGAY